MKSFLEAATYYTGLGWRVLPLAKAGKMPAISTANGGIATGKMSGITVIDVDPRHGGFTTLARLARDGLVFPPCPEERTGNGGRHLIYSYRDDIASNKNKLGPGIEVKSDGGYIVAAPSWTGPSEQG